MGLAQREMVIRRVATAEKRLLINSSFLHT